MSRRNNKKVTLTRGKTKTFNFPLFGRSPLALFSMLWFLASEPELSILHWEQSGDQGHLSSERTKINVFHYCQLFQNFSRHQAIPQLKNHKMLFFPVQLRPRIHRSRGLRMGNKSPETELLSSKDVYWLCQLNLVTEGCMHAGRPTKQDSKWHRLTCGYQEGLTKVGMIKPFLLVRGAVS